MAARARIVAVEEYFCLVYASFDEPRHDAIAAGAYNAEGIGYLLIGERIAARILEVVFKVGRDAPVVVDPIRAAIICEADDSVELALVKAEVISVYIPVDGRLELFKILRK